MTSVEGVIGEGFCLCGCGRWLGYWVRNDASQGRIRGQAKRYWPGHCHEGGPVITPASYRARWERERPDVPFGLCWCGCGEQTANTEKNRYTMGLPKGVPNRFIRYHNQRVPPPRKPLRPVFETAEMEGGWIALISLTQGYHAIVDEEDAEWLCQWSWSYWDGYARRTGSPRVRADGRRTRSPILMHRAILCIEDSPLEVDHRNHDGLDNRRSNLMLAAKAHNGWNRNANRTHDGAAPASVFKGVYWHQRAQRWVATISRGGKRMHLGYYVSEESADRAYDGAARAIHGEFARPNFPDPQHGPTGIQNRHVNS